MDSIVSVLLPFWIIGAPALFIAVDLARTPRVHRDPRAVHRPGEPAVVTRP